MLFNSLQFLIFFAVVFVAYYSIVPDRYRWVLLLASSCYFYMAFVPKFILILFFLIGLDFVLAKQIAISDGRRRKALLFVSVCANLGTLVFFRYFNFFNEGVAYLAQALHWNYPLVILKVALPLGLSFHVFQSLSYVIEVYRRRQEPERHLGVYALYVMFFPQLVAGPIERPQHMLHQFHEPHAWNSVQIRRGLELMLWGFFKKLVIADKVAILVNTVYADLDGSNGFSVLLAALLFAYQLYCDFSGYSDIAVGSAMVFGYDLTQNFNRPFSSTSIADFWRRWHISLSSWLRDYLYYPLALAGKGVTKARLYMSLVVTFALIGLWHGANWTYVVFGTLHGVYTVVALVSAKFRQKMSEAFGIVRYPGLRRVWQVLVVFVLADASFVFFRAESVTQALHIFSRIGHAAADLPAFLSNWKALLSADLGIRLQSALVIAVALIFLEYIQWLQAKRGTRFIFESKGRVVRWGWYYGLIFAILGFGYLGAQTFIYFQF